MEIFQKIFTLCGAMGFSTPPFVIPFWEMENPTSEAIEIMLLDRMIFSMTENLRMYCKWWDGYGTSLITCLIPFHCPFCCPLPLSLRPCPVLNCAFDFHSSFVFVNHYLANSTLRPPPNVDYVQGAYLFCICDQNIHLLSAGYPGIPPSQDRPQAAVKGVCWAMCEP